MNPRIQWPSIDKVAKHRGGPEEELNFSFTVETRPCVPPCLSYTVLLPGMPTIQTANIY